VDVYKQLTLIGEGADVVTVRAADAEDHVFEVTADYVNIRGFEVTGASGEVWGPSGIYLRYADHCDISENNASCCWSGYGIYLNHSSDNTLTSNNASNNLDGIGIEYSNNNTLADNTANWNNGYGITLYNSHSNIIKNNNALKYNACGICLMYSNSNTLADNTANSNHAYGIYLLHTSSGNTIYHNNFIDNCDQNAYDTGTNQWDSGSEGNYYSDYTGTDSDGDGIGDTPYPIPGDSSVDRYPLIVHWDPARIEQKVKRMLHQQPAFPTYLLNPDSFDMKVSVAWLTFTDWFSRKERTEKYDEHYHNGLNFYSLRTNELVKARNSLKEGDILRAEKHLQKAVNYEQLSSMSFVAATNVFTGNLDEAENLANQIKFLCKSVSVVGLSVYSPAAGSAVENIYIVVEYGVDRALIGESEAAKNALVKIVVKKVFLEAEITTPGGDLTTVKEFSKNRVGNYIFPTLEKYIKSPEGQFYISKIAKESFVYLESEGIEWVAEEAPEFMFDSIEGFLYEQIQLKSPGELRVFDSQGNVTGLVNGVINEEIPNSIYDYENGTVMIFLANDTYRYEVVGTDIGTYGLDMLSIRDEEPNSVSLTEIPTSSNETHQYTVDWNNSSQDQKNITVKIDSDGDSAFEKTTTIQLPTASFSYLPEKVIVNQSATFNASSSYDPDGTIIQYEWDFGDETEESGKIVDHRYSSAGTYVITLVVTDNNGSIDIQKKSLRVFHENEVKIGKNKIDLRDESDILIHLNATHSTNVLADDYTKNPTWEIPNSSNLCKYMNIDIENESAINWPINIKIYYTQEDLNNSNLLEDQFVGIYFWNKTSLEWELYSDTGVNTTDQDGYSGYSWANVTHLTLLAIGEKITSTDSIPVINTVTLNTTSPMTGQAILVTVNATDNVGVTSVEANAITLVHQGGNIWNGTITAIKGTHHVTVSASDAVYNVGWNNSTSYTTTAPAWHLHNNSTMYRTTTNPTGNLTIATGSSNLWIADEPAQTNLTFPAGIWTGRITLETALASGQNFSIGVGNCSGGIFTASGSDTINGDGNTTFDFQITADSFIISTDDYLAVNITNTTTDIKVKTGSTHSRITAPDNAPAHPVPELPSIILVSTALIILAGVLLINSRRSEEK